MSTSSPPPRRAFGSTGLTVSALGLGAAQVGRDDVSERDAEALLNTALDLGVTFFDTARSYGHSEARIARHLGHRRGEFVLSTKGGYGIDGLTDWTGACITAGVDAALARLATDYLDVFHLHSCPIEVLARGEVIDALEGAVRAGKVRVAAYSGENDALAWAVRSGRFASVEASVNLCDQRSLGGALREAAERGVGVIAKRPLANAAWRFDARPVGDYAEVYWERLRAMNLSPGELPWDEFALRFSAFSPGVSACIVGTSRIEHLRRAVDAVARGPLPEVLLDEVRSAFARHGSHWGGEV
jgi:aryl-alcohol dehydrogenase-like predicted oxidoreductase